jgi:integrase
MPRPKPTSISVYGPYREVHRGKERWRIVLTGPTGRPRHLRFATRGEAERQAEAAKREVDQRTVADARDAYEVHRRGLKTPPSPRSIITTTRRINAWFDGKARLLSLDAPTVVRAFDRRAAKVAVATMQGELCEVRRWLHWCISQGWLPSDPTVGLRVEGEANKGKAQLRRAEALALQDDCLARGDALSLAILLCLRAQLRSEEARGLAVRDIEELAEGQVLVWLSPEKRRLKSKKSERQVVLGGQLAALLLQRAADLRDKGEQWLFPSRSEQGYPVATWLRKGLATRLEALGLPKCTPQGLRGTGATLARLAHVPVDIVAGSLGHETPRITQDAYLAPGSDRQASADELSKVLDE